MLDTDGEFSNGRYCNQVEGSRNHLARQKLVAARGMDSEEC